MGMFRWVVLKKHFGQHWQHPVTDLTKAVHSSSVTAEYKVKVHLFPNLFFFHSLIPHCSAARSPVSLPCPSLAVFYWFTAFALNKQWLQLCMHLILLSAADVQLNRPNLKHLPRLEWDFTMYASMRVKNESCKGGLHHAETVMGSRLPVPAGQSPGRCENVWLKTLHMAWNNLPAEIMTKQCSK